MKEKNDLSFFVFFIIYRELYFLLNPQKNIIVYETKSY